MLNFSIFLFILSLISHGHAIAVHRCLGANFTTTSTFKSSLNLVLSNLSSNAPGANGFFNSSAGHTPDDTVYGLFQCRGDATNGFCRSCIMEATRNIPCPFRKGAVVWYDDCLLRYSDEFFFSFVSTEPSYNLKHSTNMAVDTARFNQLVLSTLTTAAAKASNEVMYFATEETTFTSNTTVYTLAQCTTDLSNSDCQYCLTKAIRDIPGCCNNKIGGRVLFPSCYVRYEIYPFYQIDTTDLAMPPPVTPQPTLIIPSGKKRLSNGVVVAVIVAPITFVLLVFVLGVCYLRRRGNKKEDSDICTM